VQGRERVAHECVCAHVDARVCLCVHACACMRERVCGRVCAMKVSPPNPEMTMKVSVAGFPPAWVEGGGGGSYVLGGEY